MTLRFPKPPPNITVQQLFQKLTPTVENTVKKAGGELLGNPIFSGVLSDKQWHTLGEIEKDLNNEYRIRREMLLKRLDCTVQSFEVESKSFTSSLRRKELFSVVRKNERKRSLN